MPVFISSLFIASALYVLWVLYRASGNSSVVLVFCTGWLILQGIVTYMGFYLETDAMPPRIIFLAPPAIIFIIVLFLTKKGRAVIDHMDASWLTLIHIVRIPVEVGLFLLYLDGLVPGLMTFEGRNFDIFSGITAPFVYYFVFVKKNAGRKFLLGWNLLCLLLLFNIVVNAILSVPGPLQTFGHEQPNIAVLLFPYSWLPCFIAPVVLFSHLVVFRKLGRVSSLNTF